MSTCPKGYYCFKENLFIFSLFVILVGLYIGYTFIKKDANELRKSVEMSVEVNKEIVANQKRSDNLNNRQQMEMEQLNARRFIDNERRERQDLYLDRIHNPLVPPEETYVGSRGVPINIPTRGEAPQFQQVGYIHSSNNEEQIPLFGRQTYPGSNKWNYYTANNNYSAVKLPITHGDDGANCMDDNGCRELNDTNSVTIPGKGTKFQVQKYNYSTPRYIPFV